MRDIYMNAAKGLIIWLQEEDMDVVQDAIIYMRRAKQKNFPEAWMRSTIGLQEYRSSSAAILTHLNNEYWSRMWIIQEHACARS